MFKSVDASTFKTQVIQAKGLVLVNFGGPSCSACEMLDEVLITLAPDLSGNINIVKVDVDAEYQLANEQRIIIMPTLKIFKNGECVKDVFGVQSKSDLMTVIETLNEA